MTTGAAGTVEEITARHRDGTLAEAYPRVAGLLADLDADGLARAGRLLARLGVDDVLAHHPDTPVLRVALTGHGTLSPLVAPLTAEAARHGMVLAPHLGDFDSWVFDLADPAGELYAGGPDLVVCVLDPAVVVDELPVPWRVEDVERVLAEKHALITGLVGAHAAAGAGTLVLNTLPLPATLQRQLVDHRSRARLGAVWREAGARLLRLAEEHPNLVVVDLDPLLAEGVAAADDRMDVYAKVHLSPDLLTAYARELAHLARAVTGRGRKVLALDLDDTLWGGVLGEDGPEGIEIGDGPRGGAFTRFQRVIKQLGSQGVLVAAVSKNDSDRVRAVLTEHPGMTLREDDFVRVVANWHPKHDNLTALTDDLGLGIDGVVFVDDSPFERGLVRRELPAVAVVAVDGEPALHPRALLRDDWFAARELTTEDEHRGARYRDELARKDFLDGFSSLEDYLHELGVRVRIAPATGADVDRVAQLTQRTNQFNLTTVRMTVPEVTAYGQTPGRHALAVHAGDRFGENGLVGAVLARRVGSSLHLDNMLLSCRVFSRGIETACLATVLGWAADAGLDAVTASYRPTAKNQKVADLYPRHGFAETGTTGEFRHALAAVPAVPAHLHLSSDLGEDL